MSDGKPRPRPTKPKPYLSKDAEPVESAEAQPDELADGWGWRNGDAEAQPLGRYDVDSWDNARWG